MEGREAELFYAHTNWSNPKVTEVDQEEGCLRRVLCYSNCNSNGPMDTCNGGHMISDNASLEQP